jgi:glycosyltransferase involved in cell wall biosynthesis
MTMRALDTQAIPYYAVDIGNGTLRDETGREADRADLASVALNLVHVNAETAYGDHMLLRNLGLARGYLVGYWAWELARLPEEMHGAFSFYDEVWASTHFAHHAFDIGIRPVTLQPMAVDLPRDFEMLDRDYFRLSSKRFLYMFNFDFASYRSRKNPEAAIQAFRKAFPGGREPVGMIVKTINAERYAEEWRRLQEIRAGEQRIDIRNGNYTRSEMLNLIRACDCYVSLHRSEGFGRGPAEAMLLERPVIATNYSGNVDFMDVSNSYAVDYELVPVPEGAYPGWRGQVWAEVDIDHAALQMRRVFEDRSGAAAIARRGRERILSCHSPSVIGKRYAERLRELGLNSGLTTAELASDAAE